MGIHVEIINEVCAPKDEHQKLFICLGGSSESGKSSFSLRMLRVHNANRIKYLKAANESGLSNNIDDVNPFSLLEDPNEDQRILNETNTWNIIDRVTDGNNRITVIESLKHPNFLRSFARTAINASLYIVYIDAEFSLRVKRESDRLGVPVTDIEPKIRLKDAEKTIHGSQEIKNIADVVLNNNGSEAEYFDWIDDFAARIISLYPSSRHSTSVEYL